MTLYLSQTRLLALLATAFALGFAGSLVYDFFRFLRLHRHPKGKFGRFGAKLWQGAEDFLFFFFSGIVFSVLFFVENDGKVRPAAFVMAALGFLTAKRLLSRFVVKGWECLWQLLHRAGLFLFRVFLWPPIRWAAGHIAARRAAGRLKKRREQSKKMARLLTEAACEGFPPGKQPGERKMKSLF